ncbi:hypothetical protein C1H46_037655 [Malus baccata]|uniref:Uncharacterized protein n=1 Tax=Malus baccata TaxID=106549 RepID=A0A540KS29_MALBA|nr:hypothetical protein C1H46_037655 [Malus baccata]
MQEQRQSLVALWIEMDLCDLHNNLDGLGFETGRDRQRKKRIMEYASGTM